MFVIIIESLSAIAPSETALAARVASAAVGVVGSGGSGKETEDEGRLGFRVGLSDSLGSWGSNGQLDEGQKGQSNDEAEFHFVA